MVGLWSLKLSCHTRQRVLDNEPLLDVAQQRFETTEIITLHVKYITCALSYKWLQPVAAITARWIQTLTVSVYCSDTNKHIILSGVNKPTIASCVPHAQFSHVSTKKKKNPAGHVLITCAYVWILMYFSFWDAMMMSLINTHSERKLVLCLPNVSLCSQELPSISI